MTDILEGQMSFFDLDTWCGKTSPEHSAATRARTSKSSSRKSSKSQNRTLPMCLNLNRGGDGTSADASMAWESLESPFPWLGEFTMHSTGVSRNGEKESVFWLTSTDPRRQKYCLTLNLSEFPRTDIPSRLSDILEQKTDKRYYLSARACEGILNRAIRRGKELPEILKTALENQIRRFSDEQDS